MTDRLPPHLLRLFTARPPVAITKPLDRSPRPRRGPQISGMAQFLPRVAGHDADYMPSETVQQRNERRIREKKEKNDIRILAQQAECTLLVVILDAPEKQEKHESDPYHTLFVGRLNYTVGEKELERLFEKYGPIKRVRVVRDPEEKSRGYGFIEFERERDLKDAFRDADGMRIVDRRVVVDVERGRTVKNWKPKRLGGGLGQTRVGSARQNQRFSGRDPALQSDAPARTRKRR